MINYTILANAVRVLSMDGVEKAQSGHPGMPMGMAEIATTLWQNHLRHNPSNPNWLNRDRFILSNGHGSMLQYSLLHLTGYDVSLDDLKSFRQLDSRTPGHPEYRVTAGVETSTGPLGQGLANGVGMALAEKQLSATFNKDGLNIIDNYTYVFMGEGCLMEGISHEACSLAGTLGLGKLIVFFDANGISIDGNVEDWFDENVAQRFAAYNWHVVDNIDGHDMQAIDQAIIQAKNEALKPSLIICHTIIGKGAPNKAGTSAVHGSPLGATEINLIKQQLNWDLQPFAIPQEVYQQFNHTIKGQAIESKWNTLFAQYQQKYPNEAAELKRRCAHQVPSNWQDIINNGVTKAMTINAPVATRKSSQNALEYYASYLPELFGGSADLTVSNLTNWSFAKTLNKQNNFIGNYLSYGVREFGMLAMINGMYLYGGFKPFGGTFLMFSEYARNAIRMAGLMHIAPIFVFTHDSLGVGEDGPTHQPIEQIATLRLIPNVHLWRPCDSVETMVAWGVALQQNTAPSCLIFSRQNLQPISRTPEVIVNIDKGGYILHKNSTTPNIVIIATGSEVALAYEVYTKLAQAGHTLQLVSMPSTSVFDQQDRAYQQQVLPDGVPFKVVIECGIKDSWYKYVGRSSLIISMDTFGQSGPANQLFERFGFVADKVLTKITQYISG